MRVSSSHHTHGYVDHQYGVGVLVEHFVLCSATFSLQNISINTASPKIYLHFGGKERGIFEIRGYCPLFQTYPALPQDLSILKLHRHPYATLTKYPRKSRSKMSGYNAPITTTVSRRPWDVGPSQVLCSHTVARRLKVSGLMADKKKCYQGSMQGTEHGEQQSWLSSSVSLILVLTLMITLAADAYQSPCRYASKNLLVGERAWPFRLSTNIINVRVWRVKYLMKEIRAEGEGIKAGRSDSEKGR